jgi:hypothetical protein
LWSVAGDDASLTAHLVLQPKAMGEDIRIAVAEMLEQKFKIHMPRFKPKPNPAAMPRRFMPDHLHNPAAIRHPRYSLVAQRNGSSTLSVPAHRPV